MVNIFLLKKYKSQICVLYIDAHKLYFLEYSMNSIQKNTICIKSLSYDFDSFNAIVLNIYFYKNKNKISAFHVWMFHHFLILHLKCMLIRPKKS